MKIKILRMIACGVMIVASSGTWATSPEMLEDSEVQCMDISKVMVPPCLRESHSLFFYKGACEKAGEIEFPYCAEEEMVNVEKLSGEVKIAPFPPMGPYQHVFLYATGQIVVAWQEWVESGRVRDCSDADTWFGIPKSLKEEMDSRAEEIGATPIIMNFKCLAD